MNKKGYVLTALVAVAVAASGCARQVSFSKEIDPILQASCVSCHDGTGEGVEQSGFSLKTYDDVMKGTKFGPVVVPGDSESSSLYRLVDHKADKSIQMPPHHDESVAKGRMEALNQGQIALIRTWIDQGAKNN